MEVSPPRSRETAAKPAHRYFWQGPGPFSCIPGANLPKWLDRRNAEPTPVPDKGAFSRPGPTGEAFGGLEVTRFLLCMVKASAEQGKHSCPPEAQHSTRGEGPVGSRGRLPGSLRSSPCLLNLSC